MTDEREDGVLAPERLARYDVPAAPAGFAARVAAAAVAEARLAPAAAPPERATWRRYAIPVVAAVAVAVAVLAVAWVVRREREQGGAGARVATTREAIALAARGVAVAEPGTELRWTVAADGGAVVEQPSGSVFYRVERGGPFEVRTPLGVVSVTGTCFSVEVEMNRKDMLKGAAVGAAIATAVVVTVYEGGVTFANSHGQTRLAPGETAIARDGAAPEVRAVTTAAAARDPQAGELAAARARIASLEQELKTARGGSGDAAATAHSATRGDPGRYYAPSEDTLREMADTCWIAFDQPGLDSESRPVLVDDELSGEVGLTERERDAVNKAYADVHDHAVESLRTLYMELTGNDADAAAALSIDSITDEIVAKSGPGEELAARRQLSRERAGLEPVPGDLEHRPIVERYLRIMMGLGNAAEAAAAGVVGAARAHDLRTHGGVGWNNTVSDYGGCDFQLR